MSADLAPAAVALETGFTTKTLANWRVLGKGPAWFKAGRLVRYNSDDVEKWRKQVRAGATP